MITWQTRTYKVAKNFSRIRWLYCTRRSFAACKQRSYQQYTASNLPPDVCETATSPCSKWFWRRCCMLHLLFRLPDSIVLHSESNASVITSVSSWSERVGRYPLSCILYKELFYHWIQFLKRCVFPGTQTTGRAQKRSNPTHCRTLRRINILHVGDSKKKRAKP